MTKRYPFPSITNHNNNNPIFKNNETLFIATLHRLLNKMDARNVFVFFLNMLSRKGKKDEAEVEISSTSNLPSNKKGEGKKYFKTFANGCVDSTASVTRYFSTSFVPVLHYDLALRIAGVRWKYARLYYSVVWKIEMEKWGAPSSSYFSEICHCRPSNLITVKS